jgi:hypothetical protein
MKKLLFVFTLLCLLAACNQPTQATATPTEENPLVMQTFSVFETRKVPSVFPDSGFGFSVGIDGDLMVVGEPFFKRLGRAAYILQRNRSGVWKIVTILFPSDRDFKDFGSVVSISGDTVVVGAPGEEQTNFNPCLPGAAYIFQRNQGGSNQRGEVKKIVGDSAKGDDSCDSTVAEFGRSVDIAGDTVVVGASRSASIFERNKGGSNAWGRTKKIQSESFSFGNSVSVSFDTVVVGGGHTTVTANVFLRNLGGAGNWGGPYRIFPLDSSSHGAFGSTVAVSGNTIVVGDPSQAIDINHDGTLECQNNGGPECKVGAAYVFEHDFGVWVQVAKLVASDQHEGNGFGSSVAVWGNLLVVSRTGGGYEPDGAYVFGRFQDGVSGWVEVKKLIASDGSPSIDFGRAVSISGSRVVVGAPSNNGAVYIFE